MDAIAADVVRPRSTTVAFVEPLVVSVGLPLLLIIVSCNLSDLAIRNFNVPSMLQPLIAVLALGGLALAKRTRPAEVFGVGAATLLIAYGLVVAISSNWADAPDRTDARTSELAKGIAILLIVAIVSRSWKVLRGAIVALVASATFLAALTVFQGLTHSENEFRGLASVTTASVVGNEFALRPCGPWDDPNFYAQSLLLCVPLAALLAVTARRNRWRWTAAGATVVIIFGTLLTYSRGAMLGLGAMSIAAAFLVRLRARHVAVALLVAAILVPVLPANVTRRLLTVEEMFPEKSAVSEQDASIEKRRLLYRVSWATFMDHPIIGVGAGNFFRHYNHYANLIGSSTLLFEDPGQDELPHSLYLEIASETGLIGLASFGAAIIAALAGLVDARRRLMHRGDSPHAAVAAALMMSLLAYLLTSLFLHSGESYQRVFLLVMGLVVAAIRLARAGDLREVDE